MPLETTPEMRLPALASAILLALMPATAATAATAASTPRPNILVILADDLGSGDLGAWGAREARTPHLDALMERGLRCDRFYANCTVCSPTRAALLTGRYPDLAGVPGVIRQNPDDSWGRLDPAAPTLPEMLGRAGYHTALVGKWHLGYDPPATPNARGFEHFHGFLGDMMDDYWTHLRGGVNWLRLNDTPIAPQGHATELFSRWAADYIAARAKEQDRPFFLYLAYNAPHFPIQPPPDWLEKVRTREPQLDEKRARNVAFVEHFDAGVGQVLAAIEQAGIASDTLIVFSSDNGGSLPHGASNSPLRGGKQDHWEGGIRVPACVVWPGRIPPGRSDALMMTMDLFPTLCEIAGVEVRHPVDGASQAPVWLHGAAGDPQRTMIWMRREGGGLYQGRAYYAIRRGRWKLLQNSPFEPMQLVDLEADPLERNPLPAKGQAARELSAALMRHIQRAGRVPWQGE